MIVIIISAYKFPFSNAEGNLYHYVQPYTWQEWLFIGCLCIRELHNII